MERNEEAGHLRLTGMTYPEIGKNLDVTALIARRLVKQYENNQKRNLGWAKGLDERIKKVLYFGKIKSKQQLQEKINNGGIKLIPGVSDKVISHIVEWLGDES